MRSTGKARVEPVKPKNQRLTLAVLAVAAIIGSVFFHEKFGWARIAAAVCVTAGIAAASFAQLVWRHPLANVAARASARRKTARLIPIRPIVALTATA